MKPPQSSQIGGKGSVRRKVKVVKNRNFAGKKTKEELHLENRIKRINEYIKDVDEEYKNVCNILVEDIIVDSFSDLERCDVKDKSLYKSLKEDIFRFFSSNLMNNKKFKVSAYPILKKYFVKECIECIIDVYEDIENHLEKKKYMEEEVDELEFTDKQCFEYLGLDITTTPDKKELKRAFKKKSFEYHPDKHPDEIEKYTKLYQNISVAYKLIIKRYKL